MSKPLIGITGPTKGGKILKWHARLAIHLSGARAQALHARSKIAYERCNAFIIGGGTDIHPSLYGETPREDEEHYDKPRDAYEQAVIAHAIEAQKPVLGICRGMQMLNVTQGGTLFQEAKDVLEDFLPSHSMMAKYFGRRKVTIQEDSRLFSILGGYPSYFVNSIHHQAVNEPGKDLRVVAAEENKLVQAIEMPAHCHPFFIGVQWHPELMLHTPSARRLFKALVQHTSKQR